MSDKLGENLEGAEKLPYQSCDTDRKVRERHLS